jgi:hypothetical protein
MTSSMSGTMTGSNQTLRAHAFQRKIEPASAISRERNSGQDCGGSRSGKSSNAV